MRRKEEKNAWMREGKRGKGMWEGVKRMCVGRRKEDSYVGESEEVCRRESRKEKRRVEGRMFSLLVYLSLDTSCCSKV